MIIFSAKKSAVHSMHIAAISAYAKRHGISVTEEIYSWRAVREIFSSTDDVLFSQSTGLASLPVLALARIRGLKVIHYLHEPTPLRRKLKENPWLKSFVWHLVQSIEVRLASRVLVSRNSLRDAAVDVYALRSDKISIAPLLLKEVTPSTQSNRKRFTYLGRIDDRRFVNVFLEASHDLERAGLVPTILTGDIKSFERIAHKVPDFVEVLSERNFSEELKESILSETLCLWNPKRGEIAQSGVTADAVRHGSAIILTRTDPSYESLVSCGVALDYELSLQSGFQNVLEIDEEAISEQCAIIFSDSHGERAFVNFYVPEVASA